METRPLAEPLPPSSSGFQTGFQFPLGEERRLLQRLASFDMAGARVHIDRVSSTLSRISPSQLRVASYYAFDLLSAINHLVWRGPSEEKRRAAHRTTLILAFSSIREPGEVRRVFEEQAAAILAPFRSAEGDQHPTVLRAKVFMRENHQRRISLRVVATHLGLSRTYLSTLFRRECGTTLTEYLHRLRLQRAQELIRQGSYSLSEVAARVGYQNYRNFHRAFVRYQQASPNRFRKESARNASRSELPTTAP